mgnify:CR=1 FL=1
MPRTDEGLLLRLHARSVVRSVWAPGPARDTLLAEVSRLDLSDQDQAGGQGAWLSEEGMGVAFDALLERLGEAGEVGEVGEVGDSAGVPLLALAGLLREWRAHLCRHTAPRAEVSDGLPPALHRQCASLLRRGLSTGGVRRRPLLTL